MGVSGLLRRLLHIKLGVVVTLVVLIALLLSLGRLAMYTLPGYKTQIEDWLSSGDYQISISELRGEWHNLWPALDARGVRLRSKSGDALFELGRLEVELDMLGSVSSGAPVFRRVVLDRLEVQLQRGQNGDWRIRGMGESGASGGTDVREVLAQILRQREIRLINALISVEMGEGGSYPPQVINAGYQRQGQQFSFQTRLERSRGEAPEVRVSGQGEPGSDDFRARFYLRLPRSDRQFWQPFVADQLPQLKQLTVASTLWGEWQGAALRQLSGQLQIDELDWQPNAAEQRSSRLQDFKSELLLRRQEDGWRFQLSAVEGRFEQQSLPFRQLAGLREDSGRLQFSLDQLDLDPTTAMVLRSPLVPEAVSRELAILQPAGMLRNVHFSLEPLSDDKPPVFRLQADLERVAVAGWEGAPEIRGVDGLLQVDQAGGRVDFDSRRMLLSFPELYSDGWLLDRARGVVSWELGSEQVRVDSERLQIWQQGIEGNGRFSLDMPHADGQQSNFTLMIGMDNSNGALAPLFVPDKIVDKGLYDWLSASIVAGHLNSGGFVFRGALESDAPAPSIQMYFDVTDGTLRYQPEWPVIRASDSFTLIKGSEVLVDIGSGRIYDTRVTGGEVRLPRDSSILEVRADLKGPAADARTVLLEAPTREYLGEEFARWKLAGEAATRLDLGINLNDPDRSRIRVSSDLRNGSYRSEALKLAFDKLRGRIRYHETKGLSSDSLKGVFFEQPVNASIDTEQRADGQHTLIRASGRMGISRINDWLQQPVLELFSGTTDYRATLDICASRPDCSRLSVHSSLRGVSSEAVPEPYAKTAAQARPLTVRSGLGGQRQWLRIRYGDTFHSLMALDDQGLSGGELVAGPGQPGPQPKAKGLWIRGELPVADIHEWQTFLNRLFPQSVSDSGRPQIDPLLKRVDLQAAKVRFGERHFEDVSARFSPGSGGWLLDVDAPVAKGRLQLPARGPFVADLAYLHLPADERNDHEQAASSEQSDPLAGFDPATLPPVHISVGDFRIGSEDYGRWQLQVEPVRGGVYIRGIEGLIREMQTEAELWWSRIGGRHQTRMELSLKADQLGDVQQAWGSEKAIEGKDASVSGELGWAGSPLNFNVESLDGDLLFRVGNGRFLEAGSAGGALKLFGLLNFKALGRRLRLDFSDLYREGLSFDTITGHYRLDDGVGLSLKPLKLSGPSADMELQGRFSLVEKNLDQRMKVTLPLAENVSLTALLLSAPQVAGAAFLIEKLVGKQLRKFTASNYSVTGSWDDPVIEPIRTTPPQSAEPGSDR